MFPRSSGWLVWVKGLWGHQTPTQPACHSLGETLGPRAPGNGAINVARGFADILRSLILSGVVSGDFT